MVKNYGTKDNPKFSTPEQDKACERYGERLKAKIKKHEARREADKKEYKAFLASHR